MANESEIDLEIPRGGGSGGGAPRKQERFLNFNYQMSLKKVPFSIEKW